MMIEIQPIKVATGSADCEGLLVLLDGALLAVLVRLADASHGTVRGKWYREAGLNGLNEIGPPLFDDIEDAKA